MHPILFHIGRLPVRSYGALIVIGLMLGIWRGLRVAERRWRTEPADSLRRIHPDTLFDVGFWGFVVGILGARLTFVLLDWHSFAGQPVEALKFWEGGLSLHGGMFFGIMYMLVACRWKKAPTLQIGDLCATSWALAYAIGRIGCYLNGCCYGGVCDASLPWASVFPDERYAHDNGAISSSTILTLPSHPVQLYATVFNLCFFALMVQWEKRRRVDGDLFWGYIGLYGFYRFVVEYFRAGATSTYAIPQWHITDTHIISVLMMALAVSAIWWLRRHRPLYKDAIYQSPQPTPAILAETPAAAAI